MKFEADVPAWPNSYEIALDLAVLIPLALCFRYLRSSKNELFARRMQ